MSVMGAQVAAVRLLLSHFQARPLQRMGRRLGGFVHLVRMRLVLHPILNHWTFLREL